MAKSKYNAKDKKDWQKVQKETLDNLNSQIQDIVTNYETNPEDIAELLSFSSNFYQYSGKNSILIYRQNRGATFVQSFDAWNKDGYKILPGQKGLKIFVPVKKTYIEAEPGSQKYIGLSEATPSQKAAYKTRQLKSSSSLHFSYGNVFDISQTSCPPEHYPRMYHVGYENEEQQPLIDGLKHYASECLATDVSKAPINSIAFRGGFYPFAVNDRYRIELNERLKDTELLSTLTHEIGHAVIHKNLPESPEFQKELEADCFSIMLESHLGIEITDSRKQHLAGHYKSLQEYNQQLIASGKEGEIISFDQIISDVFRHYRGEILNIEHHLDASISQQKMIVYEEQVNEQTEQVGDNMFNELKRRNFDTIAFYISKHQKGQLDDIQFFGSFKEAFEQYKALEKSEYTKFGYLDQRDGNRHDLIHFAGGKEFLVGTNELTYGKDFNNPYDYTIISSLYEVSNYIKEQRINYLEVSANENPAFVPMVSILNSEHPKLKEEVNIPLLTADQLLSTYDLAQQHSSDGYYKTNFRLTYRMDGKTDTYIGRYDLGDGDGGLIKHIKNFATQSLESADLNPQYEKELQHILNRLVPYLEKHLKYSETELEIEEQRGMPSNNTSAGRDYYKNFKQHITSCRGILNNQPSDTPLPDAPAPPFSFSKEQEKRILNQKNRTVSLMPKGNLGFER